MVIITGRVIQATKMEWLWKEKRTEFICLVHENYLLQKKVVIECCRNSPKNADMG